MPAFKDDPSNIAGTHPEFQEPSDYEVGQHVVFHHFDGNDYEAVVTHVWEPGSDVESRWSAHLNVGSLGTLKNVTQSGRDDPTGEGTFSLKPIEDPTDETPVRNRKAGTKVPVRSDVNPRPPADDVEAAEALDYFDASENNE